ncbi:MAG: serine/threonine protein kinase [Candidatus Obscuribacterales bacterium]|nr:serine/threonine protein kinase [Candidatus Obscuribacterales bacterium]
MPDLVLNSLFETRFRIVRKLGEGGFGEVYEAVDEPLARSVAIKILKPSSMTNAESRRRFLREGKILSKLRAKDLVQLFSVNMSEDGFLYMVMELISGRTLREKLNESPKLPEEEVLNLATATVHALSVLAGANIIHRDLKPDNIMLTGDDLFPIKLLDFGLSGLLNRNISDETQFTAEGLMIGSVHYMAPECCAGESITIATDFYALGCILYECLTGGPPFQHSDSSKVIFGHVNNMPIHPQSLEPSISDSTCTILLRLLQKDSGSRFQSCEQLLLALEQRSTDKLELDAPPLIPFQPAPVPARKAKRRRILITLSLLSVASIAAVTMGLSARAPQPGPEVSDYKIVKLANNLVLDAPRTITQLNLGMSLAEQEKRVSPDVPNANFEGRVNELVQTLRNQPVLSKHSLDPQTVSVLIKLMDKLAREQWRQALDVGLATLHCLANQEKVSFKDFYPMAETVIALALSEHKNIQPGVIQQIKETNLQAVKHAEGADDLKLKALFETFSLLINVEKEKKPDPEVIAAILTIQQNMPVHQLIPYRIQFFIVASSCVLNKSPSAIDFLRILIRLDKETIKTHPEQLAYDYLVMSEVLKETSEADSRRYADQAYETFELGSAVPLGRFATIFERVVRCKDKNDLDEARKMLRKAETLLSRVSDKDTAREARRGICHLWYQIDRKTPGKGLTADSKKVIEQATILIESMPKPSAYKVDTYLMIADTLCARGQQNKALPYVQKGIDILSKIKPPPEPTRTNIHCSYGALLLANGDFARAEKTLSEIENSPELQKKNTSERIQFYYMLGNAQLGCGALKKALHSFEQEQLLHAVPDQQCLENIKSIRAKLLPTSARAR